MKFVRVNTDGSLDDLSANITKKGIVKNIEKFITSKGTTECKGLYKWAYGDKIIVCYGLYDGEAGFENEHNLLPNGNSPFLEEESSEKLLFGNIFLFAQTLEQTFVNFTKKDYEDAYNVLFDGFDDCDDDDDEEDEDDEEMTQEDEDFIVNDSDEESDDSYEYHNDSNENELDEDLNVY